MRFTAVSSYGAVPAPPCLRSGHRSLEQCAELGEHHVPTVVLLDEGLPVMTASIRLFRIGSEPPKVRVELVRVGVARAAIGRRHRLDTTGDLAVTKIGRPADQPSQATIDRQSHGLGQAIAAAPASASALSLSRTVPTWRMRSLIGSSSSRVPASTRSNSVPPAATYAWK